MVKNYSKMKPNKKQKLFIALLAFVMTNKANSQIMQKV